MDRRWMICLLKNLLRVFLLLTAVSIVTFWLMKSSPVDPLQANVGQSQKPWRRQRGLVKSAGSRLHRNSGNIRRRLLNG